MVCGAVEIMVGDSPLLCIVGEGFEGSWSVVVTVAVRGVVTCKAAKV